MTVNIVGGSYRNASGDTLDFGTLTARFNGLDALASVTATVPEPATLLTFAIGVVGYAWNRRKRGRG